MSGRRIPCTPCPPGHLPEVVVLTPPRFGDDRGWFSETYNAAAFAEAGVSCTFVQDNHVRSGRAGTLRGLHMQRLPHAQDKLVRVLRGAVWNVAVDARPHSPTFGRWCATELSAEAGTQLFLPAGFLNGYVTLRDDTEVFYKVSGYWVPEAETGVRWDDPSLALPWPLPENGPVIAPRDAALPTLAELRETLA